MCLGGGGEGVFCPNPTIWCGRLLFTEFEGKTDSYGSKEKKTKLKNFIFKLKIYLKKIDRYFGLEATLAPEVLFSKPKYI